MGPVFVVPGHSRGAGADARSHAAVLDHTFPVLWTGSQAVVTLPDYIDVTAAGQVREQLLAVLNRGADPLVVDMAATVSCDQAGADAIARAYQRAHVSGAQLRLVVATPV